MPTPVNCTACDHPLVPHCREDHPTCRWLRCPTDTCTWTTYDLGAGSRLNRSGLLERMG